jgi:uncharacterized membrane protein YdjX (TVP38/TMEM64 family)
MPWLVVMGLLAVAFGSWWTGGIAAELVSSDVSSTDRLAQLRQFFQRMDAWAPLAYVVFVTIEVIIAPIPGLMLYAPGGLIFGPWYGGVLAVIGNIIGAGISCSLTRSVGPAWLNRIAAGESTEPLQTALQTHGTWVIVLLRLNPLTSTDLLSYAAGFTRIPIHRVMLATGLGMAPLCFAQSWLSDSIFSRWPQLLWPLLVGGVVYVMVVVLIVVRLVRRVAPDTGSSASTVPDLAVAQPKPSESLTAPLRASALLKSSAPEPGR